MTTTPPPAGIDPNWLRWTVARQEPVIVSQYCPDWPYLELDVPYGVKRVHRIVFTTVSHDQGFSSEGGDAKGTYIHSCSWFEAAVVAPSGHDRVSRPRVQYNLHAVFQEKRHVNVWDSDHEDPAIRQFVHAVRGGDRVCLVPKTRHVAWLNYVYQAEIEIFGDEEEPHAPLARRIGSLKVDESGADPTIYRPLNEAEGEFRLIRLAPGQFEDKITCSLQYSRLEDPHRPAYEALSYCWGETTHLRSIQVTNAVHVPGAAEDANMYVTPNLYDALQHLRYQDKPRMIWVDAISINQMDIPERSRQVALMPVVYTHASEILVWLGQSSERVSQTIEQTARYLERFKALDEYPRAEEQIKKLHEPILDVSGLLVDSPLFEYEYFRRTWVLQEVYNAKHVSVHCGPHVLEWAPILRLNRCLITMMLIPNPVGKNVLPALFAGLFELKGSSSAPFSLSYERIPGKLEILDVILRGLDLDATDARDKIFALLTFGEETCNIEQLPESVRPDYGKSIAQVFADFTRWWITSHKSLQILSAVHVAAGRTWQRLSNRLPAPEDLEPPSWSLWHTGKSCWTRGTLALPPYCSYSASAETTPDLALLNSSDWTTLTLVGHTISTIHRIAHYPFLPQLRHASQCPDPETCPLNALHAAYESLFDPIDERGTWRYGAHQQTSELLASRRPNTPRGERLKTGDHLSSHSGCVERTGGFECHGTTLFFTPDGARGLCPPMARVGDLVVILHGGTVPYLLRPHARRQGGRGAEPQYHFIGECYLEDYMHGRCIEERRSNGFSQREIFTLV